MLGNIKEFSTLLGASLTILIGGICWAKSQLSKDFVTHLQHQAKERDIRESFAVEINKKYKELQIQIERNHLEWVEEIRRIKEETDKTRELLFRIDEKVGLLVANKIKKD